MPALARSRAGPLAQRLRGWISDPRLNAPGAVALGLICAAAPIGVRAALAGWLQSGAPFTFFFPALLVAALWGGPLGGLVALAAALAATPAVFLRGGTAASDLPVLAAFAVAGSVTVLIALFLRSTIRALVRAGEANVVLARELRHRVKNNIAVIDGLAAQTARSASDLPTFLEAFRARLFALASTQDLLAAADRRVRVDELVREVLSPFGGAGQIHLHGDGLAIAPEQVATFSLCVHELATNATKHGALAGAGGEVDVCWALGLEPSVGVFTWRERGARAAAPPERSGFGSRLLARGLDPSRGARLSFDEGGLSWRAEFPIVAASTTPHS